MEEFTDVPYCNHESFASDTIDNNGWEDEYYQWEKEKKEKVSYFLRTPCGDFLSEVKGWVLIDDAGFGLSVTNLGDRYTKAQREFLYDYFTKMDCPINAKYYFEGED